MTLLTLLTLPLQLMGDHLTGDIFGVYFYVMTMSDDHNYGRCVMSQTKNQKLDLRLTPSAKAFLQSAAQASQRTLSEFVLESAMRRAEETLPDRQRFGLDAARWEAFQAALDAPPRAIPRLTRLMQEPSVFERE